MSTFEGFPAAAFRFYADLEENNNREWWLENKRTYDDDVRAPLTALLSELEPEFGPAKIFRPNRDIRFSQDKSPYKTAQGAFAARQEGVGFYVQLSADGLLIGGGYHSHTPAQLARYRAAVDAPASGEQLQEIVDAVAAAGFSVEGEKLKTVPRGSIRIIRGRSCSSTNHCLRELKWASLLGSVRHPPGRRSLRDGRS